MNKQFAAMFMMVAVLTMSFNVNAQVTCQDLDGAIVYSAENTPVYLGFFGHSSAWESIMNFSGPHGSSVGAQSVRNVISIYGNSTSTYSANNQYALKPPVIYKNGVFISELSVGGYNNQVSLADIDATCSFTSTVPPNTGGSADLAITIIDALDGTFAPGDELEIVAKIENIGYKLSDSYQLRFFASTDTIITPEDYNYVYWDMDALGVAESHHYTFGWPLPESIPDGQYYIGAIVTVNDDGNSSNNTKYDPTKITVSTNANPPPSSITSGFSGSWYKEDQSGHGLNIEVLNDTTTVVYWYVYHTDGTPMFLVTVGTNEGNSTAGITYYNTGMKFGEFDPTDFKQTVWGESTVTFHNCNHLTLEYSSDDPAYGSGAIPMVRLTSLADLPCSDN